MKGAAIINHRYVHLLLVLFCGITLVLAAIWPMMAHAVITTVPFQENALTSPSPELEPLEVVQIQLEALRENDLSNEGIELTYRFASPANRRVTGPLVRFIEMIRSDPYDRLLNHLKASYGEIRVTGDQAYLIVNVTDRLGEQITYHWQLTRLSSGEYKDCWMTNAVIPGPKPLESNAL
jgi:hypothetical protein